MLESLAQELLRQELITMKDGQLYINPAFPNSAAAGGGCARNTATLCHHLLATERQSGNEPQYAGERERTLAQRLSVLHGINAPEFFDKAVFSTLVLTLRDKGISAIPEDAEPEQTLAVYQLLAELITSDVRLTIERNPG